MFKTYLFHYSVGDTTAYNTCLRGILFRYKIFKKILSGRNLAAVKKDVPLWKKC